MPQKAEGPLFATSSGYALLRPYPQSHLSSAATPNSQQIVTFEESRAVTF